MTKVVITAGTLTAIILNPLPLVAIQSVVNFKVILSPIVAFVGSVVLLDEIVTLDILAYSAIQDYHVAGV